MFGAGELMFLAILVFLFFGVKRLPQIGNSLGKSLRLFKKGLEGDEKEVIDVTDASKADEEKKKEPKP